MTRVAAIDCGTNSIRLLVADATVGEDGRPRLVMDSAARGGGLNVLCAEFCPMCGRFCGKLEAEHEEK